MSINACSGKWALSFAVGAMTNQDRAVWPKYKVSKDAKMPDDHRIPTYCIGIGCFCQDQKKWKKKNFQASSELNKDLEALFLEDEKRSCDGKSQMLANIILLKLLQFEEHGKNGHRKYRVSGPHGMYPTIAYIKGKFSR